MDMNSATIGIRRTLLGFIIISLALSFAKIPSAPENAYDSIIVTKIQSITSEQYDDIEAAVSSINGLNIEYRCMWSGVMVLKLNSSQLHVSGDIHLYIKNVLYDASALKKVEILHVYTGLTGTAEC